MHIASDSTVKLPQHGNRQSEPSVEAQRKLTRIHRAGGVLDATL